jgi:hypothetical protein
VSGVEYYIIIIFIGRKAKVTIHVTVAARNNSAIKERKKITVSFRAATKKPR